MPTLFPQAKDRGIAEKGERGARIAVAGLGYVGLSLAVLLAERNQVVAVDVASGKVDLVNKGKSPIADTDIEERLASGTLDISATANADSAYSDADFIVVAVPTNYDEQTGGFDVSCVDDVIGLALKRNPRAVIVVKSTVPVGYTVELAKRHPGASILFSPEFLREGRALYDNLHPSRIIVGITCESDTELAKNFANLLSEGAENGETPILIMGSTEAEAVKLFSNSYLATRVAFFNELDSYAESRGLDSRRIIEGVVRDPRIGDHYCNPSFGYGGYCLPKDTKQLLADFADVPQNMIRAVVEANETRKGFVAERILKKGREAAADPANVVVGAYRLVMKSGSDNFRSSAIQGVIARVQEAGCRILVYEPELSRDDFNGIPVVRDLDGFKRACDVIMANRMETDLEDVLGKVYTRDCFFKD